MSSINKFSFIRWILGIALVATSGIALAGNVSDTFTTGNPLTAAQMTSIKDAINDNDTRVDGMQTGVPVCLAGMTRSGTTCVDNTRTANGSVSWIAAVNACRVLGKRLLTPGEYIAALGSGLFADMVSATPNQYEWVDSVSSEDASTPAGTSRGRLTAGYMGPDDGNTVGILAPGEIFFATNADYDDVTLTFIGYRCAR